MFSTFSFPFLRYWALVSFSVFQRWISLFPPPLSSIRSLWSLHCLSVLTQRQQSSVISGLCHVQVHVLWVFVCSWKWRVGVTCSHTSLSLKPSLHRQKKAVQQVPCRKITSCAWGLQRANLLFWIGIGKRLPIYHNVCKISLAFKSSTDNYTDIFIQIS